VDVPRQVIDKNKGDLLFKELKAARCIPDRLKLYELAIGRNGVLYLNVSREFMERDTERDITMVYGIVNSFIESFKNVKSVQLLVEGQPVYTRSGLVYIFEPLEFNKELLED
jgi:spore germination protein GerM